MRMCEHNVSVIIPVRNGERFLKEALTSARSQTIPPAEIIVVDDGSNDRSAEIAQSEPGITYLRQAALGQAAARNAGVEKASMPLLAFLDADDLWPAQKLAWQIESLVLDPKLDAVFGHAIQFRERNLAGDPIALGAPLAACMPGGLLIRRAAFLRVGGYATSWRAGEVLDWYARADDLRIRMATIPQVVLWRRLHADNLGRRLPAPAKEYLGTIRGIIHRRRGRD
jgi:glycosyltransferase involved in cell wall biosynthesis